MKIRVCVFFIFNFFISSVYALDISVIGEVTAVPCKIKQSNYTIDFKKINLANLKNEQVSQWENFTIELIDCPSYINKATLKLTGTPDNKSPQYFLNTGTAKNAALELKNVINQSIVKSDDKIVNFKDSDSKSINYPLSARIIGYNSRVIPGTFKSLVEFSILYE